MNKTPVFEINPQHDPGALNERFQHAKRLQIPNFLTEASAEYLYGLLVHNETWHLTYNEGPEHFESERAAFKALQPLQQQRFMARIYQRATTDFQYVFNQYYITQAIELGEQPGHPMHGLQAFMNSDATLNFLRTVTGCHDVRKADAYASWYEPGHFLTEHDDLHATHDRVAALVLSMTRGWNRNWGGHLAFYDAAGNIEEAYIPSFNTLNLFLIPRRHAVTQVTNFAGARRTSYLSWLHR